MSRSDLRLGGSKQLPVALADPCVQSGGAIDASMVSACLEDLEALSKKGVDEEIIRNTSSFVYAGGLCPIIVCSAPDRLP